MTTQQREPRTYVLGKPTGGSLLGEERSTAELGFLLVVGAVAVGLAVLLGGWVSWALAVLLGAGAAAAVWLPFRGRTAFRWAHPELRRAVQRVTGRVVWRSGAEHAGTLLDGTPVPVGPPEEIGKVRWLDVPYQGDRLGVLLCLRSRALHAAVEVEGPGLSSQDPHGQDAAIAQLSRLLTDLANGEGRVRRLQFLARVLPADPTAHARYARERTAQAPEALRASYEELADRVTVASEQYRNFVAVSVPVTASLSREAAEHGGGDAGLAALVGLEVEDLAERLRGVELAVVRPLDAAGMQALLANMFDPGSVLDDPAALSAQTVWPSRMTNHRGWVEVDRAGWLHATAWVKAWPVTPVRANFLTPLLVGCPGVIRTVTVTFELVPTDAAVEEAMVTLTHARAEANRRARDGLVEDPRASLREGLADQRALDIAAGAAGVRFAGWVTVSARTEAELDRARRRIRTACVKSGLAIEWCDVEQDRALLNALPLARGIA